MTEEALKDKFLHNSRPDGGKGGGWKIPALLVLLAIELLVGLAYLDSVPRVFVDEAWDSALGWNLAETGQLRHPFIEGFGGMNIRFVQSRVLLPVVCGAVFKFTDCTIFTSRLASVGFAVLAIAAFFLLMEKWFGYKQAFFICLAVIVHPWFFRVSRRARPEIYYLALGILLILLLNHYFEKGFRRSCFFAGVAAGLSALAHPTGAVFAGCVGLSWIIWFRGRSLVRLFVWGAAGFVLTIIPYLIYLLFALRNPGVSFAEQMQVDMLQRSMIFTELRRWKNFFEFPQLVPLGILMFVSWLAAWYDSSRQDKALATVTALLPLTLPLTTVNHYPRYLSAIVPFSTALIVRLFFRLIASAKSDRKEFARIKSVAAVAVLIIFIANCLWATGKFFYYLRDSDFSGVTEKVAEAVEPDALVFADPIFWYGREKYNYGPYFISYEGRSFREIIEWFREHNFKYVVRTSWYLAPPLGSGQVSMRMPGFRRKVVQDQICRLFGEKVASFEDPYYGAFEVYELNMGKRVFIW